MDNQNLPLYKLTFKGYWREMNKAGIPNEAGIYMVYRAVYNAFQDTIDPKEIIYIGQAGKGEERVCGHDKLPQFKKYLKDGEELCYAFAKVDKEDLDIVENALVFKQKPQENDYLKDSYNHEEARFQVKGDTACLKMTEFSITKTK